MQKNVSFEINMGPANLSAVNPFKVEASPARFMSYKPEPEKKPEEKTIKSTQSFSLSEFIAELKQEEPEEEEETPSEMEHTNQPALHVSVSEATPIGNLTPILSPEYIRKKNIPQAVVQEKLEKIEQYIQRYAPIAISEMKKYGVPASIKLAQGLLESNVGESRLSTTCNNHFGIKCFSRKCRKGHCHNFTDDSHKDFFRNYESVWGSYRAHSALLQGDRYTHLKKLGTKNYKAWAEGLKKAGYATDKLYPKKLIKLIEGLKLHRFDS